MNCDACGRYGVIRDTRDIVYSYKGKETVIKSITADFCIYCDEATLTHEEGARYSAAMLEFNKEVDSVITAKYKLK